MFRIRIRDPVSFSPLDLGKVFSGSRIPISDPKSPTNIFDLCKSTLILCHLARIFFLYYLFKKIKQIFDFVKFVAWKKIGQLVSPAHPLLLLLLSQGSGMDKNQDPGYTVHPGSQTLLLTKCRSGEVTTVPRLWLTSTRNPSSTFFFK